MPHPLAPGGRRAVVEGAAGSCWGKYDPGGEAGRRLRRIADHVRACTMSIHENGYPGPNKEKYVIKRLLRRAVLDGHQLGLHEPFLHELVGSVVEMMKPAYPELTETTARVADVIRKEEGNFFGTIDAGLVRIEKSFGTMRGGGRWAGQGGGAPSPAEPRPPARARNGGVAEKAPVQQPAGAQVRESGHQQCGDRDPRRPTEPHAQV